MKLLQYTNSKLSVLLFFLIGIWGVFFYFAVHHEIMDETDDMLRSYRDIFIKKALQNPDLLNSSYETTFDRYAIHPISDAEAEQYEESWLDMEVYFSEGNEHIPVRIYKSVFLAADEQFYELEISMSTLERNDLIEMLFIYLIALYALLLICIIIGNRIILKNSFKPLQKLLVWLNSIVPGKPIPNLENNTPIVEFKQLNEATLAMSRRNLQAYEQQKEFIENASHELQTPLAVAINKIELLSQNDDMTEKQLEEIDDIHHTLNKAVKLNKSLLFLSRIENQQFNNAKDIDFYTLVSELAEDFTEIYAAKNIQLSIKKEAELKIPMNEILSQALVSNLLKNAFAHTQKNGQIDILIENSCLTIKNTGSMPLNTEKIFDRFYRSTTDVQNNSTGLGLSIVKSICAIYHIKLQYEFNQGHIFMLKVQK